MSELDNIAATFGVSEPIFHVRADSRGDLSFDIKTQYKPEKTDDPVQSLLVDNWRESLDKHGRCFKKHVNVEIAYREMVDTVRETMLQCSQLKNPKQSTLYKWLREIPLVYNGPLSVGFIALYRYIRNEDITDDRSPHAKNVIAILELMKEKYEVK